MLALSLGRDVSPAGDRLCRRALSARPDLSARPAEPEKLEAGTRAPVALGTGSPAARGLCLDKPAEAKSKQALWAAEHSRVGRHAPVVPQQGVAWGGGAVPRPPSPSAALTWPASPRSRCAGVRVCGEPPLSRLRVQEGCPSAAFSGAGARGDVSGCRQRRDSRRGCRSGGRAVLAGAVVPAAVPGEGDHSQGYGPAQSPAPLRAFGCKKQQGRGDAAGLGTPAGLRATGMVSLLWSVRVPRGRCLSRGQCVSPVVGARAGATPSIQPGLSLGTGGVGLGLSVGLSPPSSCLLLAREAVGRREATPGGWGVMWGGCPPARGWLQALREPGGEPQGVPAPRGSWGGPAGCRQVPHHLAGGEEE